jgi:hypothetical protein
MRNWISKLFGGNAIDIPEGVPEAWVAAIEKRLAPLSKVSGLRADLPTEIIDYVLHEKSMGILNEVGNHPALAEKIQIMGYHYGPNNDNKEFYKLLDAVPAVVALRWARFLEACVRMRASSFQLQMPTHWLELLLLDSSGRSLDGWSSDAPSPKHPHYKTIEAILVQDGHPAATGLIASFLPLNAASYYGNQRKLMITTLSDYAEALARHVESIRAHIPVGDVAQRTHTLQMLDKANQPTLDTLASEICELAVANSKQVRLPAGLLLHKMSDTVFGPLQNIATTGKPDARTNALRALHELALARKNEEMLAYARATAAADKAQSVQSLIAEWESNQATNESTPTTYEYEMPTIDWSAKANAVPPEALSALWKDLNAAIEQANKSAREHHERSKANGHNFPLNQSKVATQQEMDALERYLNTDGFVLPSKISAKALHWAAANSSLEKIAKHPAITPVAAFKLLRYFDRLTALDRGLDWISISIFEAIHARSGKPTLLELSVMLDEAGLNGGGLLNSYCVHWGRGFASDWPDADVWPFFAHHLDLIVKLLLQGGSTDYNAPSRVGLFRAISTLPTPPAIAVNAMFSLALGSAKIDRALAQEALKNSAGKDVRIIEALNDGKSETRGAAANWLMRLKHSDAIPALERAVNKEKHDVAKGMMLDALQQLGQPIEKYLNRDGLANEAAKALAKGIPKDLEWFPWTAMPAVRWADNDEVIAGDVLRWLLVQAVKQKSAEPNAMLQKYCSMFAPADREAFGQFVLECWLREDVKPITADEAMSRAKSQAQSMHGYMNSNPQYYKEDPNFGKSVEEITAAYLPSFLRQPAGSATPSKGLLAVASVCALDRAAAPVQRYLKEWYGSRASQGKSLIAMLAYVDHPSATQLMLAIGSRFRTKSFQEEATRQAEALAERKGWTLAELADRTIPSAGFDETGTMELSYGQRSFQAKLLPDFKVELYNPDGKKITSLPEPRQDDDAEMANASKKAFSGTKKELKSIVDLQTDRLYEALCTERDWPCDDWQRYLFAHPVLRHLLQRLIWVIAEDSNDRGAVKAFRPLDDGTLSDVEDNTITLPEKACVRLAHDSLLSEAQVNAWQQHLIDYEVTPLFQQLGKGTYSLPEGKKRETLISDFKGHLIEAYALRGRALKLGYTRGPAEDGGWFMVYEKRFPTLGLVAILEFTGNPLPEENRTVALISMRFRNTKDNDWNSNGLPLGQVPKILLSECYNDLRLIAAEGSGFDPDWEKKSEY